MKLAGAAIMVAIVVLIEPYSVHATLFSEVIRMAGHQSVIATTGQEGLAVAAASLPDLVILDIVLPDCDGRDIILGMRRNAKTAAIPIMVITAADELNTELECLAFGATAFVSKPVRIADLVRHIRDIIPVEVLSEFPEVIQKS